MAGWPLTASGTNIGATAPFVTALLSLPDWSAHAITVPLALVLTPALASNQSTRFELPAKAGVAPVTITLTGADGMFQPLVSVRIACSVRGPELRTFNATEYGGAMILATSTPLARKLTAATAPPGGIVTAAVRTKLPGAAKLESLAGLVKVQVSPAGSTVTVLVELPATPWLSVAITVSMIGASPRLSS